MVTKEVEGELVEKKKDKKNYERKIAMMMMDNEQNDKENILWTCRRICYC